MTDDLIERLHSCEYVAYYDGEPGIVADENLLHEAADRIETQANTIEELRAANERWVIAFKQAAAEERAKIVAYARGHGGNAWSRDVLYFAEKVEAGEHLK